MDSLDSPQKPLFQDEKLELMMAVEQLTKEAVRLLARNYQLEMALLEIQRVCHNRKLWQICEKALHG